MIQPYTDKLPDGTLYPNQIPASKVKRHTFLTGDVIRLPAVMRHHDTSGRAPFTTPAQPTANKSGRHPLAQQWRDNKHKVVHLTDNLPILLLTAPPQPLLLTGGTHYDACCTINSIPAGFPVIFFLREYGAAIMSDLLNTGKIRVVKDNLFVNPDPLPHPTPTTQEDEVIEIPPAPVAVEAVAAVQPAPAETPKQPQPAPVPTQRQNIDPLANAIVSKQMRTNTSTAFSLAGQIHDDANAAHKWLRETFGITQGSMITADKLAAVQRAVTEIQLKFANKTTLAALNAWGMAIYGGDRWYIRSSADAIGYSSKRTKYARFLYQAEADRWLMDLRKIATPEQILEAGKRQQAIQQGAANFGRSGRVQ